ncbi:MAG: hypothetical protein QOF55_2504 [Thermoleophilaceae bacterium]|jgi:diguanylate cyclase (GGDEF)-like protein|nr:hypothetical protein [Thermoleophilaceae bacterium]
MADSVPPPVEDPSEVRSRVESIRIGSRLTLASTAAALSYAVATWGAHNRTAVVVLLAISACWALVPLAVGPERIVRSARREAQFLAWSAGAVALIGAIVAADGGASSPLALLFLLPLAFAALSYPRRSLIAVGTIDLLTFAAVGLASGHASLPRLAFFASCFAVVALLCAWEALDHDRQRGALARVSRADPLTGCLNRRGFEERLAAEVDSGTRSGGSLGLVVLDLDHFKAVNDARGHAAGDELLCWVVERAGELLRPMDSLGRLGGDEFAILLPGAGPVQASEVAERVSSVLVERVRVSTGVASFPADGSDRDSLHRSADADLYVAKHGRDGSRDVSFASALANAVNLRMDEQTSAVSLYACAIAERLGFSDSELAMVRLASILHDVGKVSVPDRILRKPGPLTLDEFEQVKAHAAAGAEIVAHVDGLSPVAEWIRHSHEYLDGSGYPHGLSGDAIPAGSRVLLVADAYDAMTTARPYGEPLPPEVALAELRLGVGHQFDAGCVDALAQHLTELHGGAAAKRFVRSAA